jgi:excisionase family DNA binding protein
MKSVSSSDWLTKEELRLKLNLPSTRMIDELMRKHKIPFIKLGHRTVRFDYEKVKAALEKFEIKAVGQK